MQINANAETNDQLLMHYQKASEVYHDMFYRYDTPYETWLVDCIMQQARTVPLVRTSLVADVGGGTGRFSSLIYKAAGLINDVKCVDFSKKMLDSAGKLNGVDAVHQDCVDFANGVQVNSFDMFLIKEMIHHLPVAHLNTFYSNLHRGLRRNGLCLTITRPKDNIDYPMFEAAKSVWSRNQPSAEIFEAAMVAAGFTRTTVLLRTFPIQVPKSAWLRFIAGRVWSTFDHQNFSNDELAKGIADLEDLMVADEHGDITFEERLVFVVGFKG